MAYSPYYAGGWQDSPSTATPIVAAALNNMETGISAASTVTLDGTAADIQAAGLRAAGAAGKAADAGHVHPNPEWRATDYGLISWSFDPACANATSTPLSVAGKLNLARLHVPYPQNVTSILTSVTTAGGTLTSGQCFAALYQAATGALLGQTADQSANWAGTGNLTMAIAGGPVAVAAGDVWVAFWFNGTTGPALARSNNAVVVNIGLSGTSSRFATAGSGITTTAPSTLSGISPAVTASNLTIWAGIS